MSAEQARDALDDLNAELGRVLEQRWRVLRRLEQLGVGVSRSAPWSDQRAKPGTLSRLILDTALEMCEHAADGTIAIASLMEEVQRRAPQRRLQENYVRYNLAQSRAFEPHGRGQVRVVIGLPSGGR